MSLSVEPLSRKTWPCRKRVRGWNVRRAGRLQRRDRDLVRWGRIGVRVRSSDGVGDANDEGWNRRVSWNVADHFGGRSRRRGNRRTGGGFLRWRTATRPCCRFPVPAATLFLPRALATGTGVRGLCRVRRIPDGHGRRGRKTGQTRAQRDDEREENGRATSKTIPPFHNPHYARRILFGETISFLGRRLQASATCRRSRTGIPREHSRCC